MTSSLTDLKKMAGEYAANLVQSGMVVGLGVGSTAIFAVRRIAERYSAGELEDILAVPCSIAVDEQARALGIPLTSLNEHPIIDLTIDGADEVDPAMNLIKGGGGALLREKIVALHSRREVIVVDESKLSPQLGTNFALPVEVVPFGWRTQQGFLEELGAGVELRRQDDGEAYLTDQGHYLLDCDFGPIKDLDALDALLNARTGIVAHGLFLGLANDLIVAGEGGIQHREKNDPP